MDSREQQRQRNRAAVSERDREILDGFRERFNARMDRFDIYVERAHWEQATSPRTEVEHD